MSLFCQRGLKPVIKARAPWRNLIRGIDDHATSLVSVNEERRVVIGYSPGGIYLADPSVFAGGLRSGSRATSCGDAGIAA